MRYNDVVMIMEKYEVSEGLWRRIEPLLPAHPRSAKGGRPRVSDRAALNGILYILKTGIPWEALPPEMNCGSGMTCWRRLHEWQQAGVWERLLHLILQELHDGGKIDWSRACIDASSVQAKKGDLIQVEIQ